MMNGTRLAEVVPRLYHMAHDGAWPSIMKHGLLSTSAVLDRWEVQGTRREALESCQRPKSVPIQHSIHGRAVIRDQKPMTDDRLRRCLLDGLTPRAWYRLLNKKVFFWATEERLRTMVGAKAYRHHPQTVLTVDTQVLVERHEDRIEVATMNTGNTFPFPHPRGRSTFIPLRKFDYAASRQSRGSAKALAEIVIPYAIPDVAEMVVRVERWENGDPASVIWEP